MWWNPTSAGARKRKDPPRAIVLHHTAGEGSSEQICKTLQRRKLSVHYTIDRDGEVTQHADPAQTVCLHAGSANDWSIGVEIASRGRAPALAKYPRDTYVDTCHGKRVVYLRFYDAQVEAAAMLCETLSHEFGIPLALPMRDERVSRDVLDRGELAEYRGVLGHLHLTPKKIDPSVHLLDELAKRWELIV